MSQGLENLKPHVIETVESRRVTIVVGATGTGKSTYVPLWLSKSNQPENKIICVQPRRVAVVSLAKRVSTLYGESEVGGSVGYRMRGDVCESSETRLVYATGGYFRAMLSRDPSCLECVSHIILDEVHERSIDSDFVSLLVKLLMKERFAKMKLVVMSATINTKLFLEYFSDLCGPGDFVGKIEIPSRSPFPIETMYLEDLTWGSDRMAISAKRLTADISDVPEVLDAHVELIASICLDRSEEGKTVLVFLPGEAAIEAVEKRLQAEIPPGILRSSCEESPDDEISSSSSPYYEIHVLHSLVPIEDQKRALKPPGTRGKHIVLATNIAESSLTVEGVNLVIDTGLKRVSVFDPVKKIHSLRTGWTSQASATQRKGRTGRVCPGIVAKLYTREMEELVMPEFEIPEAVLADPALVFLNAKYICERWNRYSPSELLRQLISYSSSTSDSFSPTGWLDVVVGDLFMDQVLREKSENSKLTIFGSLATWLQLEIPLAKLVFQALVLQVPVEGVVLAAAASMERDMFKFSGKFQAWKEEKFFDRIQQSMKHRIVYDMGFCSDLIMMRNLLVSWFSLRATRNSEPLYCSAAPFYTGGVFLDEFESFRNTCGQIARGLSDWISSHEAEGSAGGSSTMLRDPNVAVVSKEEVLSILESLEGGGESRKLTTPGFLNDSMEKLSFFSKILNHRKRSLHFTQSQLADLFLPLHHYAEADLLKLLITLAFKRVVVANAGFPRSDGEVFSLKVPPNCDVKQVVKKLTGTDSREIRTTGVGGLVALVSAGYVNNGQEEDDSEELTLPQYSEYACVTTCVALRSLLSVFEKSWKAEIGIDKTGGLKLQKPYVYNLLRWQLPGDALGGEDQRVYISPRNPTGWLETTSGLYLSDTTSSRRNQDGRRRTLASTFFAVPARLSLGTNADLSVVRADAVTVLPARCGGRVALTMLLCSAVSSEEKISSVRKFFTLDREFGHEILKQVIPGKAFPVNPAFPFWEDMIVLIDDIRAELNALLTMDVSELHRVPSCSTNVSKKVHALLDLANSDELPLPDQKPNPSEAPQSKECSAKLLERCRIKALEAEVNTLFHVKPHSTPTLSTLWKLINTVWNIYDSSM